MSKLAKAIDYKIGRESYYRQTPLKLTYTGVNFTVSEITTVPPKVREYKIGVTLEAKALLDEVNPVRHDAIVKIKRAMIEEVFGEFRPMIYNLHTALYDRDTEQAVKILNELEHVMFSEGLEGLRE
jgi:hypothetical protein